MASPNSHNSHWAVNICPQYHAEGCGQSAVCIPATLGRPAILPSCHLPFAILQSDHLAILPSCHPAILPSCYSVILPCSAILPYAIYQPAIRPSCHPAILASCHTPILPSCHPAILPSCRPTILPYFHPAILPPCHPSITPACLLVLPFCHLLDSSMQYSIRNIYIF